MMDESGYAGQLKIRGGPDRGRGGGGMAGSFFLGLEGSRALRT